MYRENLTPAERTLQAELDAIGASEPVKRPEGFDYPPAVRASEVIAREVQAVMARRPRVSPVKAIVTSTVAGVVLALVIMSVAAAIVVLATRHL